VRAPLRFYDASAHQRLFTQTRDLRAILETAGVVVTDRSSFEAAFDASHRERDTAPAAAR
jgi:hypothetical protein